MARIRSIKPEFWTDETLADCSPTARLLFIGTWNVADDYGNLERSARQVKAQIFPYDNIDCESLLTELLNVGVLVEYEVEGKKYMHIKNFGKHQKIDKMSKARCPLPEGSPTPPREDDEEQDGKGREGKGKEGKEQGNDDASASLPCPHDEIIAAYHEALPACPRVRMWTDKRRTALRSRWRENASKYATVDDGIAWWRKFFGYVSQSDFLAGKSPPQGGRQPFMADLEWLVTSSNFVKVIEGKYHA